MKTSQVISLCLLVVVFGQSSGMTTGIGAKNLTSLLGGRNLIGHTSFKESLQELQQQLQVNEIERHPCSCAVFLSGQFTKGSKDAPRGSPALIHEHEDTFQCTLLGLKQCTNWCLESVNFLYLLLHHFFLCVFLQLNTPPMSLCFPNTAGQTSSKFRTTPLCCHRSRLSQGTRLLICGELQWHVGQHKLFSRTRVLLQGWCPLQMSPSTLNHRRKISLIPTDIRRISFHRHLLNLRHFFYTISNFLLFVFSTC